MKRFEVVVLAREQEQAAVLARRVEALVPARVQALTDDAHSLAEALAAGHPAALVADLGEDAERVFAALEALPDPRPPLLVCGPADDARLMLRAMRLGAREFVAHESDPAAFQAAFERLLRKATRAGEGARGQAPLIAVLGAKGGVGTTFVASQLAVVLGALGGPTALFDLALPAGDVALHLDFQPRYSLAVAARATETLDATFLRTLLSRHASGVQVLCASERAEDAELLSTASVERAIALLRPDFEWVVMDLGRGWDEAHVRALDVVDHVVLVTQAEVPALVNARRQLDLLGRLGVAPERVHVVENRHGRSGDLSERDVRRYLPRPVEVQLPEDATVASCTNEGRALGAAAPYGHAHRALVNLGRCVSAWCGREELPPARAGLLERVRVGLWRKGYGAA